MAEIPWHTGTASDSSELDYAEFYEVGSLHRNRSVPIPPTEEAPLARQECELQLVFKNKRIVKPIFGEDALKDLAALKSAEVPIHYHRIGQY